MKLTFLLLLYVFSVSANLGSDETRAMGAPKATSFGVPGALAHTMLNILSDQENDLLYFIGTYYTGTFPVRGVIYKSDLDLEKVKVMTYVIDLASIGGGLSENGDILYFPDRTTNKIYEINTANLQITRSLSIPSSSVSLSMVIRIKGNLFLSIEKSSVMHTCRWDITTSNLDGGSFGVNSYANFAPISSELLFFASVDSSVNEYYLVNYNFSDTSNLVWKK